MRAIVCERYGSPAEVLSLRKVADPEVGACDVLVKVHAASVNAKDWRVPRADPFLIRLMFGLRRPHKLKVLGSDIAGIVQQVGPKATRFKAGDAVFGELAVEDHGGFSELASVAEARLAHKPQGVSFEAAAAIPLAGMAALQGLRDFADLKVGQHVLITGAGGGVGSFAIQIAKAMGAAVTAVCGPDKVELAKSLGADHVIDYTKQSRITSDRRYDVVFDIAATSPIGEARRILTPTGTYVFIGGTSRALWQAMWLGPLIFRGDQRFVGRAAKTRTTDLELLADWLDRGRIKSIVGRTYTLEEAPAAVAHVAAGHAKGKTIIVM